VHFTSGREIYLTCGHISGWIELPSDLPGRSNTTWTLVAQR
jgi:hypothetical protein